MASRMYSFPVGAMLARDAGTNDAIIQTGRIIVHDHREQASLLQGEGIQMWADPAFCKDRYEEHRQET